MELKAKEKKLLMLAGILFVLVLARVVVPMLKEAYDADKEQIALLQERIDRYRMLFEEESILETREGRKREEIDELESWVFEDSTLLGTSIQRELRRAVDVANVNVREISVARYARAGDWLVANQQMSFIIDQENILQFLSLLRDSRPRLQVTEFSITRSRRQYTGNLTVTGFSRVEE